MTDDTTQMAQRARALNYALSLLSGAEAREGRDAAAEQIGLLAAVGTVVGVLAKGMAALSDKANAVARDWPSPGNADYADGSASDGDRTDWSTER